MLSISGAQEVCKSISGQTAANVDLQDIAECLAQASNDLIAPQPDPSSQSSVNEICKLAASAKVIADETKPWHPRELRTALCKLKHVLSRKTCLFIDGLDEYVGDHVELIEIIRDLSDTKNIKLCVSSRPWPCFEDAFGKDSNIVYKRAPRTSERRTPPTLRTSPI